MINRFIKVPYIHFVRLIHRMFRRIIMELVVIREHLLFLLTGRDMNITLHFGGVSSAYKVWVNGKFVGYAEDSFLAIGI